jgi:hypothetical protein
MAVKSTSKNHRQEIHLMGQLPRETVPAKRDPERA